LKCDGARAGTRFCLSAKRKNPFKSAGASVQSTTDSRGVRISDSNAGYTMFRGSVNGTGYPTSFASFPFTFPPIRHRVPSHFNWSLTPGTFGEPIEVSCRAWQTFVLTRSYCVALILCRLSIQICPQLISTQTSLYTI